MNKYDQALADIFSEISGNFVMTLIPPSIEDIKTKILDAHRKK